MPGLDYGNSPASIAPLDLAGVTLVEYSAGGVRGLIDCDHASEVLAGSLVCARATAEYIRSRDPPVVTFVITGLWTDRDGDEDHACADLIEAYLLGRSPALPDFEERVRRSDFGRRFGHPDHSSPSRRRPRPLRESRPIRVRHADAPRRRPARDRTGTDARPAGASDRPRTEPLIVRIDPDSGPSRWPRDPSAARAACSTLPPAPTAFTAGAIVPAEAGPACHARAVHSRRQNHTKGKSMSNFWDSVWLIFSAFLFVAYLFVMFQVIMDLFRDDEVSGFGKAAWIVGLIFLPMLTALVYIIARGSGMAERQRAAVQRAKSDTDAYIRQVAGKSPAEQIADAKALLDAGTIAPEEFQRLKAKALA